MRVEVWPSNFATTAESVRACFIHEAYVRRRSLGVARAMPARAQPAGKSFPTTFVPFSFPAASPSCRRGNPVSGCHTLGGWVRLGR